MASLLENGTEVEKIQESLNTVTEDPGVIKEWLESVTPGVISFLVQLIITIVILLIGIKLANFVVNLLRKSFEKSNVEKGVATFLCSLVKYILYFILIMILLSQFGITTGSVVAVLGSAGLTVGLALQGSLANFAGGVLILMLKPFLVGDYIVAEGQEGTVESISIFYTRLNTPDNKVIMIPNGALSNCTVTNVSHMKTRRLDFVIGVSYESSLSHVKEVLYQTAVSDEAVLQDQDIKVFVSELAESSVNMGLRVWVNGEDYWTAKWRITENIKNALDENGISIPYPQLDVHQK